MPGVYMGSTQRAHWGLLQPTQWTGCFLFSALSGLPRQSSTQTLNIQWMCIKSYATALLPSLLLCSIIRTRGRCLQVMAMYYWNPPNWNLSLEAVDAFLHHLTSTDLQPSDWSDNMASCWLASPSITKVFLNFLVKGRKKNPPSFLSGKSQTWELVVLPLLLISNYVRPRSVSVKKVLPSYTFVMPLTVNTQLLLLVTVAFSMELSKP